MGKNTVPVAETIIATLRAHEAELRRAGLQTLSLFGSVARGDAEADSDVDLATELDPDAKIGLIELVGLEMRLGELVGRSVDLVPEVKKPRRSGNPRLSANIERDRVRVF